MLKHLPGMVLILITVACSDKSSVEATQQAVKPATITATQVQDMVYIGAGEFIMGTDEVDASGKSEEFGFNEPLYLPEQPRRRVNLKAYYIDKYEVSNADFKAFLRADGRFNPAQLQTIYERLHMKSDLAPVRIVTWQVANDYCRFLGKRLPTEAEWEKAARGPDGREYPWGDEWKPDYLNAGQGEQDLTAVGSFELGKSYYGVYDMAGNVMEWTADWYEAYPGAQYQSPNYGRKHKVVRGGGWGGIGHYVIPHYFRTAYRYNFDPSKAYNDVGFRCVKDT
ncbi:MAG: formylglycine-generating enzyme family protein [Gammaproteobacteria bacterium]|nr:formylglycine-generating enzyme family protein [Gammaproteobacteria bacterium]MDH5802935.1 formylglycine-generating enzyme family protein [Gammaproteobacteria bacterium]